MNDPTALLDDHDFVVDFCRFSEGILDEKFLRKKYRFDNDTWERLGESDELVSAIETEKVRRIRDGSAKREKSQLHVVHGPDVLNGIMLDANASPRHRVDAIKTLDQFAANGPEAAAAESRFVITINLTADRATNSESDIIHFDKPIAIGTDDTDHPDNTVVALPTKKSKKIAKKNENGDAEPV
jgi:hypothetical protein